MERIILLPQEAQLGRLQHLHEWEEETLFADGFLIHIDDG